MSNPITCSVYGVRAQGVDGYYGCYPVGFMAQARDLLGVRIYEPVLHVCSGMVRKYKWPEFAVGPEDKTLDLDPALEPDFLQDARDSFPLWHCVTDTDGRGEEVRFYTDWAAIMIDRPYSEEDADHYAPGRDKLPTPKQLMDNAFAVLRVGHRVGYLDYISPTCPKNGRVVANMSVMTGHNNRIRWYTVYEKTEV